MRDMMTGQRKGLAIVLLVVWVFAASADEEVGRIQSLEGEVLIDAFGTGKFIEH